MCVKNTFTFLYYRRFVRVNARRVKRVASSAQLNVAESNLNRPPVEQPQISAQSHSLSEPEKDEHISQGPPIVDRE